MIDRFKSMLPLVLACVLGAPGSALAGYSVNCESKGDRYTYCNAKTEGKVRLAEQYSKSSCRQGRDWGYDWNGVWVSNGCRARFDVGQGSGGNNDAGKALAVAGGLAILGAMIANSDQPNRDQNSGWNGDHSYYAGVPPWAIGTFSGQDPYNRAWQTISIDPNGGVARYTGNAPPLYGNYNNGAIIIQGRPATIAPAQGGIVVSGVFYRRQ